MSEIMCVCESGIESVSLGECDASQTVWSFTDYNQGSTPWENESKSDICFHLKDWGLTCSKDLAVCSSASDLLRKQRLDLATDIHDVSPAPVHMYWSVCLAWVFIMDVSYQCCIVKPTSWKLFFPLTQKQQQQQQNHINNMNYQRKHLAAWKPWLTPQRNWKSFLSDVWSVYPKKKENSPQIFHFLYEYTDAITMHKRGRQCNHRTLSHNYNVTQSLDNQTIWLVRLGQKRWPLLVCQETLLPL